MRFSLLGDVIATATANTPPSMGSRIERHHFATESQTVYQDSDSPGAEIEKWYRRQTELSMI